MNKKNTPIIILVLGGIITALLVYFVLDKAAPTPINSTAETAFEDFKEQKQELISANTSATLIAVGDISYSRGVGRMVKHQNDINFPFKKTADILRQGDIVYGNLETPITPGREILDGEMLFRSDPGTENALKDAGFTLVNLANNHTYNFEAQGLTDTFTYLNNVNIDYVGAGKNKEEAYSPIYIEKNGIKFAFLSYEIDRLIPAEYEATDDKPGIAYMRTEKLKKGVEQARKQADIVIVFMHAGEEYQLEPNDEQKNFAHSAIDYGANMVIGDHPHVVERAEIYKDKYIFYNLGNFVMDQMWSDETRQGLILSATFNKTGVTQLKVSPYLIHDYSQPNPVTGTEAENIVNRLGLDVSKGTKWYWNGDKYTSTDSFILEDKNIQKVTAERTLVYDTNSDGYEEKYRLKNGTLTVSGQTGTLWQSPDNWWIDDFAIADSNNDGKPELNMSVWKEGSYGPSRPMWVKENDTNIENHFFVFKLENEKPEPLWQSSALDVPNCSFTFGDINQDGTNELIVAEGIYDTKPKCNADHTAVWTWNNWGFTNDWRSPIGLYNNIKLEKSGELVYITK